MLASLLMAQLKPISASALLDLVLGNRVSDTSLHKQDLLTLFEKTSGGCEKSRLCRKRILTEMKIKRCSQSTHQEAQELRWCFKSCPELKQGDRPLYAVITVEEATSVSQIPKEVLDYKEPAANTPISWRNKILNPEGGPEGIHLIVHVYFNSTIVEIP